MSGTESFLHSFATSDVFKAFNLAMQEPAFLLVVLLFAGAAFFIVEKKRRPNVVVSLILTAIIVTVLKYLFAEARPCVGLSGCEADFGFPSGHAALAFSIAAHSFGTKYFYGFLLVALAITLSRVIANVHSFPQVLAGAAIGFAISIVSGTILNSVVKNGK